MESFIASLLPWLGRSLKQGQLNIHFPTGRTVQIGRGKPTITITVHEPGKLLKIFSNPTLGFGEAYMHGWLTLPPKELPAFLSLMVKNEATLPPLVAALSRLSENLPSLSPRTTARDKQFIASHYDLGNDFYQMWLDPSLTYSCAYFKKPTDTLEMAEKQKINHVLKKLKLEAGQSLIDVGCGWGSVIRAAAERYSVKATGITLSEEQAALAAERTKAVKRGSAKVELIHSHNLARSGAQFDRLVSIGMAEHIGKAHLAEFAADLKKLLKPGGRGLLHLITSNTGGTDAWIEKYIFPGGYIPAITEVYQHLLNQGFHIWEVENIGPHYALTLDRWANNFDKVADLVETKYGVVFVRMWRLYLRASAESFRDGNLSVSQYLFTHGIPTEPNPTLGYIYE